MVIDNLVLTLLTPRNFTSNHKIVSDNGFVAVVYPLDFVSVEKNKKISSKAFEIKS